VKPASAARCWQKAWCKWRCNAAMSGWPGMSRRMVCKRPPASFTRILSFMAESAAACTRPGLHKLGVSSKTHQPFRLEQIWDQYPHRPQASALQDSTRRTSCLFGNVKGRERWTLLQCVRKKRRRDWGLLPALVDVSRSRRLKQLRRLSISCSLASKPGTESPLLVPSCARSHGSRSLSGSHAPTRRAPCLGAAITRKLATEQHHPLA